MRGVPKGPRFARNAFTSRTLSRGRQPASRVLRYAAALRVTAVRLTVREALAGQPGSWPSFNLRKRSAGSRSVVAENRYSRRQRPRNRRTARIPLPARLLPRTAAPRAGVGELPCLQTQGLPGLIGRCSNRTNEEESPMRLTTILRNWVSRSCTSSRCSCGGRVGCACRYARRQSPAAGRAAAARRATTGDRSGCGGMCRGDRRRCGCGMRRGGCRAVTAGCGSNRCRGRRAAARSRRRARSWWRIWRRRWIARRSVV